MLNDLMNKMIKKEINNKTKNREVNFSNITLIMTLGIRIILIYLLFIFLVGKYTAELLGYNNLYFLSIILATLCNVYIIYQVIKDLKK